MLTNLEIGLSYSLEFQGYYDKNVANHSLNESNDLHGKPPTGVIRHQTLRSNSEPHGHTFYGGGTDLAVGPGPNHVVSNIYGNHIVLEDQGIDMSQVCYIITIMMVIVICDVFLSFK